MNRLINEEEEKYFVTAVNLKSGKSFGELALIKNKPRAATIKCTEECHIASMSKADYEKVLARIEQKTLDKILEFLSSLPLLKSWTKTAL